MPAPETLLAFFGIAVLLALAPGPDNVFVLMQSAAHGRRAGLAVVLGLCTGLMGHTLAVAVGLAALLATSAAALAALKLAGAVYLLYLAWGAWRVAGAVGEAERREPSAPGSGQPAPRLQALYRRGIIMNLTNPKVTLFFLALFPQFVAPTQASPTVQIVILGVLFILATLLVFGGIAYFAGLFGERLASSSRAQRCLNRCASVVFGALALRLVLA